MDTIIDTIIAQATPIGKGGIGILRISGVNVINVAKIILGLIPKPRYANYLNFYDLHGVIIDRGIAIFFPKPHSFTGEDILELHCHGGQVVINLLLKTILNISDIRIANPGEFTERAFINNKIDLIQAEAIIDLINANTEQAARSAINSLHGMLSNIINDCVKQLITLRAYIESRINFSETEVSVFDAEYFSVQLKKLMLTIDSLIKDAGQSGILRNGVKIVIFGEPNVGKSSLLNALSGNNSAIITDIAGTTRDVLHEYIYIDDIPCHIVDTAGLHDTNDIIENIGIQKAVQEINTADYLLYMVDSVHPVKKIDPLRFLSPFINQITETINIIIVRNKIDLTNESIGITKIHNYSIINISVIQQNGLDLLRNFLKETIKLTYSTETTFLARQRHITLLKSTSMHLHHAYELLCSMNMIELIAEELYLAQQQLNKITGTFTSDDLLKHIFSEFCIGK